MAEAPHSAPVLTDLRDGWWSTDFLALLAQRMHLGSVRTIADIGCGHGHWGQRLLPLLSDSATIEGMDMEQEWVVKATVRAESLSLGARCHYQRADAAKLPYRDSTFDMVTCQTLLMHVPDVPAVLKEMLRILKPGGRLLLAEPNNLAAQFIADTSNRSLTPEQLGDLMTLFVACSRGRANLGRGDDCIGDRLPGLLSELGVQHIYVCQNEQTGLILPPYTESQLAQLAQSVGYAESGFWLWDKEDARTLYNAGGGNPERFEGYYDIFSSRTVEKESQIREKQYTCNNPSIHYIISGIKPRLLAK